MIHNTQSAQISQKQDERNLHAIMKTMCPPGYQNGFVATHALGHVMCSIYIYLSVYSVYICLFIILWGWQLPLYFFPPFSCQAPFFEIFPAPLLKIPPPLRAKMFSQLPSPNHIFNGTFFFSLKLKLKKMSDFTYFETHLC